MKRRALALAAGTTVAAAGLVAYLTASPTPPTKVIVAAGDIADRTNRDRQTAALVDSIKPDKVLTLGDQVYENGRCSEFAGFYQPDWGRFKNITKPVPGNHDPVSSCYTKFYGGRYVPPYRWFLGQWTFYALDSERNIGVQSRWLAENAALAGSCSLAYWHYPRFTSGNYRPGLPEVQPLVTAAEKAGVDVILNGHDHLQEVFGIRNGVKQFTVGSGGRKHYQLGPRVPGSRFSDDTHYGVLKMELAADRYDWTLIAVGGQVLAHGGRACQ